MINILDCLQTLQALSTYITLQLNTDQKIEVILDAEFNEAYNDEEQKYWLDKLKVVDLFLEQVALFFKK